MNLTLYGNPKEKICLEFYPCVNTGEDISWDVWHKTEPLTIFLTDYRNLILKYLCDIYPAVNPTSDEIAEHFEECWDNWIGKKDWNRIIKNIEDYISDSENVPEVSFYIKFIEWIAKQLEWADIIVVEGNL